MTFIHTISFSYMAIIQIT